jgi:hypothetical protein
MVKEKMQLKGKGLGIATDHSFEDELSSMLHEQLARLMFAETIIDMITMKKVYFEPPS